MKNKKTETARHVHICKECSFEIERNGHSMQCSQRIKSPADFGRALEAIKHTGFVCPECKRRGKFGTLELLNAKELAKLKDREGREVPDKVYGCDECHYWIDAKEYE